MSDNTASDSALARVRLAWLAEKWTDLFARSGGVGRVDGVDHRVRHQNLWQHGGGV